MRSFAAVLAGVVANFGTAGIVGFLLGPIAEWLFPRPDMEGRGVHVSVYVMRHADDAEPGMLIGVVLVGVIPVVVGAFVGGAVAAAIGRSRPGLVGVLTCLPVVGALIVLGDFAPAGEGLGWLAAIISPAVAVAGALMVDQERAPW